MRLRSVEKVRPRPVLKTQRPSRVRGLVGAVVIVAIALGIGALAVSSWRRAAPAVNTGAGYQAALAVASQYARSLQTGQVQQALLKVAWVQDRLERVKAEKGNAEAENAALAALVQEASASDRTRAVISKEGIEDQYIFVPKAQVEPAGADAGRAGLERKVAGRAWLRVTYPEPGVAPKDENGRAVKGLTVGVNMSEDGYVLKAEIIGNLELDRFSIRYF